MVPALKDKSRVGLFSYWESGKLAFSFLHCHLVNPEVIFKEAQRWCSAFSNLFPSRYNFCSAVLISTLALWPSSVITLLFVLGAGCISKFKATNTAHFGDQYRLWVHLWHLILMMCFCTSKWENMLEKKILVIHSWYIWDIILKSEIMSFGWELVTVKNAVKTN
jgi:hypothetical protein